MLKITIIVLVLFLLSCLRASTIGIATGTKTVDGNPLLFKNKDRKDNYPSDVNFYEGVGENYSYVFQQNHGQNHERARMGINSAGFGIVYTTSENLDGAGSGLYGSQFSALALKSCSSIQDFRDLLYSTEGKRRVHEHFAIIDSTGHGALFEVDGYAHVEISIVDSIATMANTAKYHPNAGPPANGSTSPEREARAFYLLTNAAADGLDYRYFVHEIIKDFSHSQTDEDNMPLGQYSTNPVLSRYKTAAGGVIKGIKPGDDPGVEPVMWLCLSEPSLSIALPFFVNTPRIPDVIRADAEGDGLAGSSDRMRKLVYDYNNGRYSDRLVDSEKLMEIRAHVFPLQDSLFYNYDSLLINWRNLNASSAADEMQAWASAAQKRAKTDYDNIVTVMHLDREEMMQPESLHLSQNYPNPFNPNTTIAYTISISDLGSAGVTAVNLSIYNIIGQKIYTLIETTQKAGYYSVEFNAAGLAPGVYIYQLKTDTDCLSGKMIYLP